MMMVAYPSKLTRKRKSQTSCQPSSSDNSSAAPCEGEISNMTASPNLEHSEKV